MNPSVRSNDVSRYLLDSFPRKRWKYCLKITEEYVTIPNLGTRSLTFSNQIREIVLIASIEKCFRICQFAFWSRRITSSKHILAFFYRRAARSDALQQCQDGKRWNNPHTMYCLIFDIDMLFKIPTVWPDKVARDAPVYYSSQASRTLGESLKRIQTQRTKVCCYSFKGF